MIKEDLMGMALRAGLWMTSSERIEAAERFAELVAAAERKAIIPLVYGYCESDNAAQRIVDAIKKRGEA